MPQIITKEQFLDQMANFSLPISFSALSAFLNSPKLFLEYYTKERDEKDAEKYVVGSAFHCLVLEPQKFDNEFAVAPECDRRTNAGKEVWASFCKDNADKKVLTAVQMAAVQNMAQNLQNNPLAVELLQGAAMIEQREKYVLGGFNLHAVKDIAAAAYVADLKSTQSASYWSFKRSVRDYKYHLQAAIYLSNQPNADFYWIANDSNNCIVYQIDPMTLQDGERLLESTLQNLRECTFKNEWHRCGSYFNNKRTI